jgi:hypothetical protein
MAMADNLLELFFLRLRIPKLKPGLAALFACLIALNSGAASFTASLDRDTITLGETATLSLKFEGGAPEQLPSSMTVSNLQLVMVGGPSHFDININGNRNSYDTYNYVVTPTQAGQFTIPALTANVNGKQMASQPLKLTVNKPVALPAGIGGDSQIAFARLSLPRKEVYSGETVVADMQLFYRQDVQLARDPQLTGVPADGFTVGKIAGNNQSLTQVGNAIYNVIPAKIALTVNKTGAVHLGPVTVSLVLLVPSNDRQSDPIFDPFGMLRHNVQKPISIATSAVDATSLPLPSENAPTNFSGAIGDYTMAVSAGPTNVTVGDPVTVRVQIAGAGDFSALKLPDQSGWSGFKLFPPTSKVENTDPIGVEGTKTFEEIVTPQNADVRELPPVLFSFFNPNDGKYHTLAQSATPLVVRAAGATPMPAIAASKNSAPENQTPQDILPIKDSLGTLAPAGPPLVARPAFLVTQSVPVLAFLAAFIWRKRTDSLANNPRLRRQRAVAQLVRDGLNDLKKHAAANQPDEFFALLFRLLQEQLGERLDCPASAITENVIEEHPILRGVPKAKLDALRELFQLCNQARYAPVRGASELNSVAAKLEQTISELQEVKA